MGVYIEQRERLEHIWRGKIDAFLREILAVCEKHDMTLSIEEMRRGGHTGFDVVIGRDTGSEQAIRDAVIADPPEEA